MNQLRALGKELKQKREGRPEVGRLRRVIRSQNNAQGRGGGVEKKYGGKDYPLIGVQRKTGGARGTAVIQS